MPNPTPERTERRWRGIGVSPGVARAEAHLVVGGVILPVARPVPVSELDSEWKRFEFALEATKTQVEALKKKLDEAGEGREAGIFDVHILILEDSVLLNEVERTLREQRLAVDAAFYQVMMRYQEAFDGIEDEYLRERAVDMEDVAQRVLRNLRGHGTGKDRAASLPEHPHVLVARDLSPSDTAAMDRELVRGFVTELGSHTSHTAILARSFGIPAVVGLADITDEIESGADVLVDGYLGLVIVNPTLETLRAYERLETRRSAIRAQLQDLRDQPAETMDGRRLKLAANIEFLGEIPVLKEQGAEGVGLFRTEFFYLKGDSLPTEEEQFLAYTQAVREVGGDGVIFRTFDIGGDKLPTARHHDPEPNPFLGWRGIRVSLEEKGIFKTQLRAILRASGYGKALIMFPMVATREEVRAARAIVRECMDELRAEGKAFDEQIAIGAMIEVPGAAMAADLLAPEVDFFSIGTNDLTQYTIAVDRVNERVAGLYEPMHPGVLRLIDAVVKAAAHRGIWVGVCGEAAGDVLYAPLLIGLGVDELSVGPRQVLRVKRAVRSLSLEKCRELTEAALGGLDTPEITARCEAMAREAYPELLE
jgi:phosphotransferase system enzyme I (PtsI)